MKTYFYRIHDLIDENRYPRLRAAILRREPEIDVVRVRRGLGDGDSVRTR